jgi:uncharacterized protein YhaN
MKVLRLDLLAFGPFTETSLDLSAGEEGFHLIYGPNEAGKSTTLRALRQLLFGIPATSTDNFVHSYPTLRIGAALQGRDGTALECLRRKGNKNTLLRGDDSPLDESVLAEMLGGVDQTLFETMFAIDHTMLRHGGEAIVQGGGEIGRILFAAGASIGDLRAIQKGLEVEAGELFLPHGKNPRINQALTELEKARRLMRESELPGSEWAKHDEALREARRRKQDVERELDALLRDKCRLERIRDALPTIASRRTRLAERQQLGDVVLLAEDFGAQRREALLRLSQAQEGERDSTRCLEELDREIAALQGSLDQSLLAHANAIKALQERLGSHKKAQADRGQLAAELGQLEADARSVLHGLRPDLGLEQVEQLRLSTSERLRNQELATQHPGLVQAGEAARATLATINARIETSRCRLAELEAERDPTALRQAVRRAQQAGPIQAQREELFAKFRRDEAQAGIDCRALPLWNGTLDDLERLAVPATDVIERRDAEHAEYEQTLRGRRGRLDEITAEESELARQLEQLRLELDVPTEPELDEERGKRDADWHQIREAWKQGREDAELARSFEDHTRRSDEIADRLRREAHRVATRAQLVAEQKKCGERRQQLGSQLGDAETRLRAAQEAWAALWQPAGIVPMPPRDMRGWERQWADLAARARSLREQRARFGALDDAIRVHSNEIGGCLAQLGEPAVSADEKLTDLLERGQRLVDHLDRLASLRNQLREELTQRSGELPQAQAAARQTEEDLAGWRERWKGATERLGIGTEPSPAEAAAVLDSITTLFARLATAESHRLRIAGIDRDAAEFARELHDFTGQTAPDLAEAGIGPATVELAARLQRASAAQEKVETLRTQREREARKLEGAQADIAEAQGRLKIFCREAGCHDIDGLARAEECSAQRRHLDEEIHRLEEKILQRSAGSPLEAFLAEAKAVEPDALAGQLDHLEHGAAERRAEKELLDQKIGAEQTLLHQMDGTAQAAEAAEQVQTLLAQVGADAEQYARIKLAAFVLREAIERYREKNQAPVLKQAGGLFAELTRGSFAGLRVDFNDKGEAVLFGIRPGGKSTVGVDAMSDGTRDQLYLALRLASLETFLERHEPLPFVVDDVLIHFDDDRARTVLKVLAEFSKRTQVIFFTHHEHLVRLAEGTLPVDVLFVHRLGNQRLATVRSGDGWLFQPEAGNRLDG